MLAAHEDALLSSQTARRAAAWDVIARVVADVPLAEPTSVEGAHVPRFRTWYDGADFTRAFEHAYAALSPSDRAAHARLSDAMLDDAFDAAVHTQETLGWTDAQWTSYVAMIHDGQDVANIGGVGRIAMSPSAARHVARSYPEIMDCVANGAPPAFVDGPGEATQRLAHEPTLLDRCTQQRFGPYWVASTGRIEAHLTMGDGTSYASLRLIDVGGTEVCVASGTTLCETQGPGAIYVEVTSGGLALDAMLDVTYTAPDVPFASCLDGVFPLDAATVAQEWRRVELGPLPTFDTSAAGLARRMAEGAEGTWGDGDGMADPGPDAIYTQRLGAGSTFRLAGMHIRTRELDHWMNITMWWTDRPDEDFGADRPEAIRALGGPWAHYAMCVAIDDVETDVDPRGGATSTALGDALAAVRAGTGGPSWCSNPYIDAGPGAVRTNCVGCHQHADSGVLPSDVVLDEMRFPQTGRLFQRNNFPADAFWGIDAGDRLEVVIQNTIDYWATAAP